MPRNLRKETIYLDVLGKIDLYLYVANRADMGVRLFKKFLLVLVDTASKTLDQTTMEQITPALLMRKATVRYAQKTLSDKTLMELAMGRKPRYLLDPASMNPEQLTSTPTKQDLLNEEIQKLAMSTHLEAQQREDIRRDLAERMKFVPPDLRAGDNVFDWQDDPSKIQQGRKSGKWLKVKIIVVKESMELISVGATIFQANVDHGKETFGHCGFGRISGLACASRSTCAVALLWRSNRCLGALLWQLLIERCLWSAKTSSCSSNWPQKKEVESSSPQLLQGFWHKFKKMNPKIVVISPIVEIVETKSLLPKKWNGNSAICVWTLQNFNFFHNFGNLLRLMELISASRERFPQNGKCTLFLKIACQEPKWFQLQRFNFGNMHWSVTSWMLPIWACKKKQHWPRTGSRTDL